MKMYNGFHCFQVTRIIDKYIILSFICFVYRKQRDKIFKMVNNGIFIKLCMYFEFSGKFIFYFNLAQILHIIFSKSNASSESLIRDLLNDYYFSDNLFNNGK